MGNKNTIITYGTFDLLHVGHIRLLKRIKKLGDNLIVGLSTDEFNLVKGKKSIYSFADRKEILESLEYVDKVIPENNWEQKITDIKKHQVDLFVMGDDWSGKFDYLMEFTEVCYLPRTQGISTTDVKSVVGNISEEKKQALKNLLSEASKIIDKI